MYFKTETSLLFVSVLECGSLNPAISRYARHQRGIRAIIADHESVRHGRGLRSHDLPKVEILFNRDILLLEACFLKLFMHVFHE